MSEAVSIETEISSAVRHLPETKKAEVLDFVEWLSHKTGQDKELGRKQRLPKQFAKLVKEGTEAIVTFVEKSKPSSDDDELLQRWLRQGLISSISDQEISEEEFEPILVKGKPVSEIIIEDRGPR